jgi:hypothetical protein
MHQFDSIRRSVQGIPAAIMFHSRIKQDLPRMIFADAKLEDFPRARRKLIQADEAASRQFAFNNSFLDGQGSLEENIVFSLSLHCIFKSVLQRAGEVVAGMHQFEGFSQLEMASANSCPSPRRFQAGSMTTMVLSGLSTKTLILKQPTQTQLSTALDASIL